MAMFLITFKLQKNPFHNPHEKVEGACPINGAPCTDTTGEHHTILVEGPGDMGDARAMAKTYRLHITRIEEVSV